MRKQIFITGLLCGCLLMGAAACSGSKSLQGQPDVTEQGETNQPGQSQETSGKSGLTDEKQHITPTKNPWSSKPDFLEEPTEPAKDFFGETVTGEVNAVGTTLGNMSSFGFLCEEDGFIYYINHGLDNTILCKESIYGDGSEKTILADEEKMCFAINVMGNYVYYSTGGRIKRVPKTGGEPIVLSDIGASSMVVTEDKIYFTSDGVYSMNRDGSDRKRLTVRGAVKGESELAAITVYRDYVLYVAERDNLSLYAVKKDGTEEYLIQRGVVRPALIGDCVYFPLRKDYLEEMPEFGLADAGRIVELSLLTGERRLISEQPGALAGIISDKLFYNDYSVIRSVSLLDGTDEPVYPCEQNKESKRIVDLLLTGSNRIYFMDGGMKYIDVTTGEVGTMK